MDVNKTIRRVLRRTITWGIFNKLRDETFLKLSFWAHMGTKLNLDDPKTFSEKLQWLKINDRKPEYTIMVDKYAVRQYIAEKIGEEYLIPLIGVWDDPDEIDFDLLPNQFVLKCNHNSGTGMCICKDKAKLDIQKVKEELRKGLAQDYYIKGREWPYKHVSRKIIAEQYMSDSQSEGLRDYKVLCFEGVPKLIELHGGRFERTHTQDFYDTDWNLTEYAQMDPPPSNQVSPKPHSLEKMIKLSRYLAEGIHHLRVDWYEVNDKLYFGELTFFDGSGFCPFVGNQDEEIGRWIHLNS